MIAIVLALASISDCDTAARLSGLDYRQCLGRISEQADREMALQWRAALAAVRRQDVEQRGENKSNLASGLLRSQRAWLRYREAECQMISDQAAGGTAFGEIYAECLIVLTRQRTDLLRRRASGFIRYVR